MKNKLLLMILPVLLATSVTFGQVRFGIRGGINSSRLETNRDFRTSDYRITYPNFRMLGFHAGLITQVQLFNFFIQPELLYTSIRNDIDIYDLSSANPALVHSITQKRNQIDVPVMLGVKFKILKLEAGPVATFLISNDSDLKMITSYDLQMNKANIGFQAGVGLDVGKLALDVKYEGSLSKLGTGIKVGGSNMAFDSRMSQIIVSVGLFF